MLNKLSWDKNKLSWDKNNLDAGLAFFYNCKFLQEWNGSNLTFVHRLEKHLFKKVQNILMIWKCQ